ncbi:ketopantoate reductase C-terminal domain-containing protein [Aquimarina algiphila]|uniref:2-dehydropantoate 2-reductase n=1 Tax=Aquimarina algiphila TaxID=2047982 RepID=A0A554VPY0_9FLAO|nr:ketopantoate reductase C-terminal domain-containing protein [Aquimarina algiphila]TSE10537.1 hypothetical protein FOF46_04370 [Aquimarina algiphila]
MDTKTIGILGIGAIGSVIASLINPQYLPNTYHYNRSPRETIKIKRNNIKIEFSIRCDIYIDKKQHLDWLIICLKEYQFENAKEWLSKLIGPSTKIVVIRNGLQLKEPILEFTSENYIIECMIDCPVQPGSDGFYEQLRKPTITISKKEALKEFSDLFNKKELCIKTTSDFKTESWKKVCESSTLGAILCLTGETCWVFKDPKMQELYKSLLIEGINVAKADGANINDSFIDEMFDKLIKYPDTKGSSMLTDRRNGNPIELGAKNGVIKKKGAFYHINTPFTNLICNILSKINRSPK